MIAYKKYKNRLEKFLQGEQGKRFINFAYSFGAAIVILGAMFNLLHFPFGNEIFFFGMITEVVVFILSAFDTPVRDYRWEQVFPALSNHKPEKYPGLSSQTTGLNDSTTAPSQTGVSNPLGYTTKASVCQNKDDGSGMTPREPVSQPFTRDTETEITQNLSLHVREYSNQIENLNRTLSGLNSIYEIHLRSISGQIDTIEQINRGLARIKTMYNDTIPDGSVISEETEKMAGRLKELNEVYARMLNAITLNRSNNTANNNP